MTLTTTSSSDRVAFKDNNLLKIYFVIFVLFWAYTLFFTADLANWVIENILTIIALVTLTLTYKKFKFSDLSYTLIFVYTMLHIYGAMYTYAENPLGYWLKDVLDLERNHYDRIVHFSFGFLLGYPLRDYFKNWFDWPNWVCWTLPIEITMSFSGAYEIIEWLVADVFFTHQGTAYLGTQGDVWDAQKDMALALSGAILIMVIASNLKKLLRK
ncbi:MAG: DUF2238 domain-containing protein [Bacteroidia bacterium]|jgi:putative membrane protein